MIISRIIKRYLFVIVIKIRMISGVMTLVTWYNHKLSSSIERERGNKDDDDGSGSNNDDDVFVGIAEKSTCIQLHFRLVL